MHSFAKLASSSMQLNEESQKKQHASTSFPFLESSGMITIGKLALAPPFLNCYADFLSSFMKHLESLSRSQKDWNTTFEGQDSGCLNFFAANESCISIASHSLTKVLACVPVALHSFSIAR